MSEIAQEPSPPPSEIPPRIESLPRAIPVRRRRASEETRSLYALTACLVAAATSWFLLKELEPLLRPLVLAVFLAYLIVPIHLRLRHRIGATVSAILIVGGTCLILWGVAIALYGGIVELNADLPRLTERLRRVVDEARAYGRAHLPPGLSGATEDLSRSEAESWDSLRASLRILVSNGAAILTEASIVGIYLIFLLLELRRFPNRIRAGFEPARAETVLNAIARINAATISYLRAKTVASLAAGIPTALVLWAFGVRHPVLWGLLIFFGNFIPYIGSLVALVFPLLMAFLDLEPMWKPWMVTFLLIVIQVVVGYVIEPILAGKAVNLSPLVTLLCLAFWSLCWGLTGMLLAVPLTAMIKIIWENMAYTRPLAILMADADGNPP